MSGATVTCILVCPKAEFLPTIEVNLGAGAQRCKHIQKEKVAVPPLKTFIMVSLRLRYVIVHLLV